MKRFEPNKTITELGIDPTRKFVAMNRDCNFNEGDILTLVRDDKTPCPKFKNQNGVEGYFLLVNLAYYEEEMKEGDLVYVSDSSEENALRQRKERILLRKCSDGYVCICDIWKEEYKEGKAFGAVVWDYAVPIPKEQPKRTVTLELTEEQIEQIQEKL